MFGKMAATCNFTVATYASAHFVSDKNCNRLPSRYCASRSTAALIRTLYVGTKAGRRKGLGLKTGWVAERLMNSKKGGRSLTGGSVRAEIYVEGFEDEVETETITIPDKQTAWIYKEYGPKEVLGITEIVVPKVGPDQVLVKVYAGALNPVDFKRRLGKFKASDSELPKPLADDPQGMKLKGMRVAVENHLCLDPNVMFKTVPGYDVAGVVVQVGSEVTKFKVGDRVYGDVSEHALNSPKQYGSLAQYCAVEEKLIAVIPQRLSFAEAASLPLAVETAYQGFEHAGLKESQTVLVLGGAGGVGSLAIQLAKHVFKASLVAATASTPKVDFVKGLGADIVIDYRNESLTEHQTKYDVVLDTVGKGEAILAVKENGRAVVLTGPAEPPVFRFVLTSKGHILETLNPLLEDGTLKPIVDPKGRFKFSELVEAFAYLEEGRASGKVVISLIAEEVPPGTLGELL